MEHSDISTSRALQSYFDRQLHNVRTQAEPLRQDLLGAGVAAVRAEYDGCGDSGQFEQLGFVDSANAEVEIDEALRERVTSLLYDLIELRHGGWENNDGAFGSFRWILAENQLHHEHNDRYTEVDYSEYEGFPGDGEADSTLEGTS